MRICQRERKGLKMNEQHTKDQLKSEERTRCEVWTRVMGYHRPTASFNKGKFSEHRERRFFIEARCVARG